MNLLLFSPTFHPDRGGAESLTEDLAASFVERGHAVTVLTASGALAGEPATHRGARVVRVRYPPHHRPPFAAPSLLRAGRRLRQWHERLLAEARIDAVCVARVDESCRYVLAPRGGRRFRLSVQLHGAELRSLARFRRFRWVLRSALRAADAIVAVSEDLRRETVAFEPRAARKLVVVPNGVDVAAIRAARPASRARPYVLFVGRLERVKNPAYALAAFARAAAVLPALDLVLAGGGSEEPALRGLVAAHGLAARVAVLGTVERARVYELMRGAELVVVPSLAEGHPLVVLEAWAAGTPVLASDAKGLRNLVDGAARFPLDDPAAAGDLIVRTVRASRAERAALVPDDVGAIDLQATVDRHLAAIARVP